jgi:hypothetical protein
MKLANIRDSKSRAARLVGSSPTSGTIMKNKLPINNKALRAYVIGLALGDGNLSNPNGRATRLRITCDLKYPKLIKNIQNAIRKLLPENKVAIVKRKANCLDVSCYSNNWESILGWKSGNGTKFTQNVDVPEWIKEDKYLSVQCLRGLIETDGSIYFDRGYPMVMFVTVIQPLAKSVMGMIENLGFKPRIYSIIPKSKFNAKRTFHIRISKNVYEFLRLVKPQKK